MGFISLEPLLSLSTLASHPPFVQRFPPLCHLSYVTFVKFLFIVEFLKGLSAYFI
jgi:hypothetical protein